MIEKKRDYPITLDDSSVTTTAQGEEDALASTESNGSTTEVNEDVQTQTENRNDTTKMIAETQTRKIATNMNDDETTSTMERTTKSIRAVQTDDMKETTSVTDDAPTNYNEGTSGGTVTQRTDSESSTKYEPVTESTGHNSQNRKIATEGATEDTEVSYSTNNMPVEENSSLVSDQPETSSSNGGQESHETQSTTIVVDDELTAKDTTTNTFNLNVRAKLDETQNQKTEIPVFVSTKKISRILGGPKEINEDKYSQISRSFRIFLKDFVNIISSAVREEELSQEKSTFHFNESDPEPSEENSPFVESAEIYDLLNKHFQKNPENDLGSGNGLGHQRREYDSYDSTARTDYDGSDYKSEEASGAESD